MVIRKLRGNNKARGLCKLSIDEDITISCAEKFKTEMSGMLEVYKRFEFDLNAVEEIDTAGIQLLLALKAELAAQDKEFSIINASASVLEMMKTFGLVDFFNLEVAA
ncbi:hypothetical protein MNBD_GAMMA12-3154 [hydrothermal vent metagenome]|uniref:STAS domain-containing protein n=1 Tax=hydrothermal vent metagenome TaxID=652676 RepID=A0A3B0YR66_9ZZZZ